MCALCRGRALQANHGDVMAASYWLLKLENDRKHSKGGAKTVFGVMCDVTRAFDEIGFHFRPKV